MTIKKKKNKKKKQKASLGQEKPAGLRGWNIAWFNKLERFFKILDIV